jgi:two-component system chemotaxis response regulator CheB
VVAAILSGALDDGAVGAAVVAETGGVVVVQDPGEAQFPGMPSAALAAVPTAIATPVTEMAALVTAAVQGGPPALPRTDLVQGDAPMSMADHGDPHFLSPDETRLTRLVCPDCDGSLAQVDLRMISYFRCHVGHQWSSETLAAAQTEAVENKLWSAMAALEEQAALRRYLAAHRTHVTKAAVAEHLQVAAEATDRVETLRTVLDRPTPRAERGNGEVPTS